MERVSCYGWKNCWRLNNTAVELIVTADVGPRVIHFGLPGGANEFHVFSADAGRTGDAAWRPYGGHRLWVAPEHPQRSYVPDNAPVQTTPLPGGLRASPATEALTGVRKELDVTLVDHAPAAVVTHRLINESDHPVELAPWALSVMAPGGVAILPLPPRGRFPEQLLPNGVLTLWAYTDLADPRWVFGRTGILLRQDAARPLPQKIGVGGSVNWIAYARGGNLVVKRVVPHADRTYPDFGCLIETFTNADMLEIETLGPLATLQPGESLEHVERWFLLRDVATPRDRPDIERVADQIAQTTGISSS